MTAQPIDTLFDEVWSMLRDIPPDPESSMTFLHMAACRRGGAERVMAALVAREASDIVHAARLMILECDPIAVVLQLPSWSAALPKGKEMSDYGVKRVSELPREMVRDTVFLGAEDESGAKRACVFLHDRATGVWSEGDSGEVKWSRFDKLFLLPEFMGKVAQSGFGKRFGADLETMGEARELARTLLLDRLGGPRGFAREELKFP